MQKARIHLLLYLILLAIIGGLIYHNFQLRQTQDRVNGLLREAVTGVGWNNENLLDELSYYMSQVKAFDYSGRPDSVQERIQAIQKLRQQYYAALHDDAVPDSATGSSVSYVKPHKPLSLYEEASEKLRYQRQFRNMMFRISQVYGFENNLINDPNYLWATPWHEEAYAEGDTAKLLVSFHTSFDLREDAWRIVKVLIPTTQKLRHLSPYQFVVEMPTTGMLKEGADQRRATTVARLVLENRYTATRETTSTVIPFTVVKKRN
jgi:uncharacterized protein YxeA